MTAPIVKHSYLVTEPEELPRIIKEAFYIASTGRPGPVSYTHLDVYKRQHQKGSASGVSVGVPVKDVAINTWQRISGMVPQAKEKFSTPISRASSISM